MYNLKRIYAEQNSCTLLIVQYNTTQDKDPKEGPEESGKVT